MPSSEIHTIEDLERLAKLITRLFEKWNLSTEEKQKVFNKTFDSRDLLVVLTEDDRRRAEYLLNIHAYLRLLYPRDSGMRYRWIKLSNNYFHRRSPLTVITEGIVGLETVARYLQLVCQR